MGERMPAGDCGKANANARLAALERLSALDQALELEYGLTGNPLAEWIPVSERLPGYGEFVIVAFTEALGGERAVGAETHYHGVWTNADRMKSGQPTHWMPLPEPPEEA